MGHVWDSESLLGLVGGRAVWEGGGRNQGTGRRQLQCFTGGGQGVGCAAGSLRDT